jgi:hypothetical protein
MGCNHKTRDQYLILFSRRINAKTQPKTQFVNQTNMNQKLRALNAVKLEALQEVSQSEDYKYLQDQVDEIYYFAKYKDDCGHPHPCPDLRVPAHGL